MTASWHRADAPSGVNTDAATSAAHGFGLLKVRPRAWARLHVERPHDTCSAAEQRTGTHPWHGDVGQRVSSPEGQHGGEADTGFRGGGRVLDMSSVALPQVRVDSPAVHTVEGTRSRKAAGDAFDKAQ
jgi:hypothetical protein